MNDNPCEAKEPILVECLEEVETTELTEPQVEPAWPPAEPPSHGRGWRPKPSRLFPTIMRRKARFKTLCFANVVCPPLVLRSDASKNI